MKTKRMLATVASLILALCSSKASAVGYATYLFPGGFTPTGYSVWYSVSFSYTVPDDFDDVIGLSLAAEAIAPLSPYACITLDYFSGWQTTPNYYPGVYVEQPGTWFVWCTGFYFVAGLHVFYLYDGNSFGDVTFVPWGFF